MKTRNYIYCLTALLIGTACSNTEDMLPTVQDEKNEIQFAATLQEVTAVNSRANGETNVLRYVNDIRIRKIDISSMSDQHKETQIFNVKPANYGTLDMETAEGTKTAMEWTDKENNVDFYAWTVPTGVSIDKYAATGTVDFGIEAGNKCPTTDNWPETDKYDDNNVTPLEVFISAYKPAKFTESPSVNLGFSHVVSKVSIIVRWWTNKVITDDVTITFPAINQKWNVVQTEENGQQKAFTVTDPVEKSATLSFTLNQLYKPKDNYRTFYLPPLTKDYNFKKAGDFEVKYGGDTYYGSLNQIVPHSLAEELKAGEHLTLEIHLNPNFNAGGTAYIHPWKDIDNDNAYANPYRGIYTLEGLKVLKSYLAGTINYLPDSLYIDGTETLDGKKIIRLYNDLTLTTEEWSLVLKENMIFDGLGHIITVPGGKSLFGEVSATENKEIAINNIRLAGEGQLAASLENVSVYNCHANGTANLVGTAKGITEFDFCSAENSAGSITLMGSAEGNDVTVTNSFVASSATKFVSGEGTITAKNSFIIKTPNNTYWSAESASGDKGTTFTIDPNNVTATTVTINDTATKLIDLLNTGSEGTGNQWVYVYGKNYPVMRIK